MTREQHHWYIAYWSLAGSLAGSLIFPARDSSLHAGAETNEGRVSVAVLVLCCVVW